MSESMKMQIFDRFILEFRGIRLQFTFEDEKQTGEILDDYIRAFEGRDADSTRITEFTRGHFKRRVE